jgi:hypothetical protein
MGLYTGGLLDPLPSLAVSPYRKLILADNPVAYYRMNDLSGSTLTHDTYGANGTLVNGPTLGVAGPAGMSGDKAIRFANNAGQNQYANLGNVYNGLPGISVECWVKFASISGDARIVDKFWNGSVRSFSLGFDSANNKFFWLVATDTNNNNSGYLAGSTTPVIGTWYHLCGTWDSAGAVTYLYVNAVRENSTFLTGNVTGTNTANLSISTMNYAGSYMQFTDGTIDEVAIYNYRLPIAKIAAHYTAGSTA